MKHSLGSVTLGVVIAAWGWAVSASGEECPAPPEWFPVTPKPTNAKPDPDKDCDFYKWAWQTFLYVTQPEREPDGLPRFLLYETPDELFGAHATPRFPKGRKRVLTLAPRLAKHPSPLSSSDILQAGSNGVLVDQNGRAVYYGIHLNGRYASFIRRNGYTDMQKLKNAPADQEFPRGTLELKSSWKVVVPGEDTGKFFTTKAVISLLKTNEKQEVVIDPTQSREETVALLGLHVVGVVDGHPEFIWATFEQAANAPDLNKMFVPPGQPGEDPQGDKVVDGQQSYTLYAKGSPAKECNLKQVPKDPKRRLRLTDPAKQTLEPKVNVFRQFPFGNDDDPSPIINLNQTVHAAIDKGAPKLAIWKNYDLRGAVWLNNPAYFRENFDFSAEDQKHPEKLILGGDKRLSNATMETFTQDVPLRGQSCFDCHRTRAESVSGITFPAKRLSVSHILTNVYSHTQQALNRELGGLEAAWAAAVEANDPQRIGRFLAEDFLFVGAGGVLQTRTQHLEDFRSGKLKVESVTLGDLTVRTYEGMAVVSSRVMVKGKYGDRDISGPYQFTDTWVRQGRRWQAAARQQTRVASP